MKKLVLILSSFAFVLVWSLSTSRSETEPPATPPESPDPVDEPTTEAPSVGIPWD